MDTQRTQTATADAGRKPGLYGLWYVEASLAFAAVWALLSGGAPGTLLAVVAYLLVCGAALTLPAHALRLALARAGVRHALRVRVLEVFLVMVAAATAATLSTDRGWAAIVYILLIGNALWALELEQRAAERGPGITS